MYVLGTTVSIFFKQDELILNLFGHEIMTNGKSCTDKNIAENGF